MPRKNRIEYPGAMYHVLNRENYRRDLFVLGRSGEAFEKCLTDRKGADWKVTIARRLRRETTASNPWIAQRLNMGHPSRVSNLINGKTFKF